MSNVWTVIGHVSVLASPVVALVTLVAKGWWDRHVAREARAEQRREEDERHFRDRRLEYAAFFISKVNHINPRVGAPSDSPPSSMGSTLADKPAPLLVRLNRWGEAMDALSPLQIISPSLTQPAIRWAGKVFLSESDAGEHGVIFMEAVQHELGLAVKWPKVKPEDVSIRLPKESEINKI